MKKAIIVLTAAFLLCLTQPMVMKPSQADPAQDKTKQIEAVGHGQTKDEAVQDAMRNAVTAVVGMYLTSTTQVENAALIEDKILTYSNAYVTGYDLTSVGEENGFVRVGIVARVVASRVGKSLTDLNIAKTGVVIKEDKIDQNIAAYQFNSRSREDFRRFFVEVIMKPFVNQQSHKISIKETNVYEITGFKKSDSPRPGTITLTNIENDQTAKLTFENTDFIERLGPSLYDYVVFELRYSMSVSDEYFENVKRFLDLAADSREAGISTRHRKDRNHIILTSASDVFDRNRFSFYYEFNDGKWGNIVQTVNQTYQYTDPSRMWGNNPYVTFLVNDQNGAPLIRWKTTLPDRELNNKLVLASGVPLPLGGKRKLSGDGLCEGSGERYADYNVLAEGFLTRLDSPGCMHYGILPAYDNRERSYIIIKNDVTDYASLVLIPRDKEKRIKKATAIVKLQSLNLQK